MSRRARRSLISTALINWRRKTSGRASMSIAESEKIEFEWPEQSVQWFSRDLDSQEHGKCCEPRAKAKNRKQTQAISTLHRVTFAYWAYSICALSSGSECLDKRKEREVDKYWCRLDAANNQRVALAVCCVLCPLCREWERVEARGRRGRRRKKERNKWRVAAARIAWRTKLCRGIFLMSTSFSVT